MSRLRRPRAPVPTTHPKVRALALMVGILVVIVLLAAMSSFGPR